MEVSKQACLTWSVCIKNQSLIIDARQVLKKVIINAASLIKIATEIEIDAPFPLGALFTSANGTTIECTEAIMNNTINPYQLSGVGRLKSEDDLDVLLVLLYVEKQFSLLLPNAKFVLKVVNRLGVIKELDDYTYFINSMQWDEKHFNDNAERLGLIIKVFDFKTIDDEKDYYF